MTGPSGKSSRPGSPKTSLPTVDRTPSNLMPMVYDELRRLARHYFRKERSNHTLQPTALVHEAYLRLADQKPPVQGRAHFLAICARAMRQILVDYARTKQRVKRGGEAQRIEIDSRLSPTDLASFEILALHDVLDKLAELDPRQARIVEMRFFGGLTVAEIAEVLEVSKRTVEGDWQHAKAWLRAALSDSESAG
jgi:RNA polymerase sigma factor (TIGR02999 family)